jgi:hypothetical protein
MLYLIIDSVDAASSSAQDTVKLNLAPKAFEVLTALTSQKFEHEHLLNNPNSPPLTRNSELPFWPNVTRMLDTVSKTTPPITVREKVIRAVLHTYSP